MTSIHAGSQPSPGTPTPAGTLRRFGEPAYKVVAIIAFFAALYLARDLLIPIALAIFFAFLLAPLVRRAQCCRLGRVPAVFLVVLLAFSILSIGSWYVGSQAVGVVEELPKYRANIVLRTRALRESVGEKLHPFTQMIDAIAQEIAGSPENAAYSHPLPATAPAAGPAPAKAEPLNLMRAALAPLLHPFLVAGLAAVYSIFFLIYREDLRDRLIRVCGDARIAVTTLVLTDAGTRVSRYFVGMVLANSLHGAAVALGLTILGFPNPLVFGVMSALFRFIPFLGPTIAAVLPTTIALAIFDGWTRPLAVLSLFIVVDMLSANFLEPWLYGARTGASATAIILSTVLWTWLWGPIGLVLATPITVCLVVLGKAVPQFQALYVLLGDKPVLEPHARLYQRLVAMDEHEARDIVDAVAREKPLDEVFAEVVIPALSLLAAERQDGEMDEMRGHAVGGVVDHLLGEDARAAPNGEDANGVPLSGDTAPALIVPIHGLHDILCARTLVRLFESRRGAAIIASQHLLISELVADVCESHPAAICLLTVHSANISRIELLCRRLNEVDASTILIVAVWDPLVNGDWLERRFSRFSQVRVCPTLSAALQALQAACPLRSATGPAIEPVEVTS